MQTVLSGFAADTEQRFEGKSAAVKNNFGTFAHPYTVSRKEMCIRFAGKSECSRGSDLLNVIAVQSVAAARAF